ncbi:MAG: cupin domain-containing protein [Chloroflexi bacterium]|nr:cupin domain-containing protein [Chloroflexota bacterium]
MAGSDDVKDTARVKETFYDKWVKAHGIPVVSGYGVEDLNTVRVEPWTRKGGKGAFVILRGGEGMSDAYVCEIPPGGSLKPQRHLFEETIYILSGSGATSMWWNGREKQTFEWHAGSLFAPPLNVWHQHFNGQGDKPVRYLAITDAPLMLNLIHNHDFVFNNDFAFTDRYQGEEDYFNAAKGKLLPGKLWDSNFVPDIRSIKTYDYKERGAGGTTVNFEMSSNIMASHISEFPVGTYKKAHRHGPGTHVVLLNGEGFSLMWPEDEPKVKVPWRTGSLLVPPGHWWHQHLNVGSTPARYLAVHMRSNKFPIKPDTRASEDRKTGGNQIEYEDQDPEIEKEYQAELNKRGLTSKMGVFFQKK